MCTIISEMHNMLSVHNMHVCVTGGDVFLVAIS